MIKWRYESAEMCVETSRQWDGEGAALGSEEQTWRNAWQRRDER